MTERQAELRHAKVHAATKVTGFLSKTPILQAELPQPAWIDATRWRLPGVQPLATEDWLIRDDAFDAQMQLRDHLISSRPEEVRALLPRARAAANECFETVIEALKHDEGYIVEKGAVTRPDGVRVTLDLDEPLCTLGRLIQADLCLMEPEKNGHVLTGAILCFPAHWTLAEKLGRPLSAIHSPVAEYDDNLEKRVQRLFDGMKAETLLWRSNAILYEDAQLFAPKSEGTPDISASLDAARYVRSERQVLRKLPESGAVVFSIHTIMVAIRNLGEDARRALPRLVR